MASESQTLQPRDSSKYRYRWHSAAFLAFMFVLAMLALAAIIASSRATSTPLLDERTISAERQMASVQQPAAISLAWAGEMQLMLPIFEGQVTALGYHPADDPNVVSLRPDGHKLNGSMFGALGHIRGSDGPGYFVMDDSADGGSPTDSLDVGAPAGTVVFAPVDGVVAGIREYDLKGSCPDTEIKIQPFNQSNIVVVMTHLENIQTSFGQRVRAGVSKIGSVSKLDGCMEQQLKRFTSDTGNHLHLQVEVLNNPRLDR